jgi:hypothetical protein
MSHGVILISHPGNEHHLCNIPQGRVIYIDLRKRKVLVLSLDKKCMHSGKNYIKMLVWYNKKITYLSG